MIGLNRPGALWSTTAGTGLGPSSSVGNSCGSSLGGISPPSQRRLATNTSCSCETTGPFDAHEQVVERAVLEVILDSCTADPADAAVDDDDLAMVDVPEPAQVPAGLAAGPERPRGARAAWRASRTPESPPAISRS